MPKNPYLTEEETRALDMLAKETSYHAIRRECNVHSARLPLFMQDLRRKTGIHDTRDAQAVQTYLTSYEQAVNGPGPNARQLECIKRVLGVDYPPHSLEAAAYRMDIKKAEAHELYESGLRAAGIFSRDPRTQRGQARIFLAIRPEAQAGRPPLSRDHIAVLELLSQGYRREVIAAQLKFSIGHTKLIVSEIAQRLGAVSRGRGAQEKLILLAAAHLAERQKDEQKEHEIDMSDPAFN